jgi:hypothetical protein
MKTTCLSTVATLCAALLATAAPGDPFGTGDPFGGKGKAPSAGPALQKTEFRVGKIGRSGAQSHETAKNLVRLFDELNTDQAAAGGIYFRTTVLQAGTGGGVHLCENPLPGPADRIAVVSSLPGIADGAEISGLFMLAGTYKYTAVSGASVTVQKWVEAVSKPVDNPMTREAFLARLKAGATFAVTLLEVGKCHTCFGKGTLGALRQNAACPDCGATGAAIITYTLRW